MESIKQIANCNLERVKSKLQFENKLTSFEIRERVLLIGKGLISTQSPDMTAWHCKCFKTLGEQRYSAIASSANKDSGIVARPKLFSYMLKEEMDSKCKNHNTQSRHFGI